MTREDLMREALAEGELALLAGEVPVGAVVVWNDKIISRAQNAREKTGDPTAHAEILALRKAAEVLGARRLSGCTLYVTLEPCPMCAGAILMSGISQVVYAADDPRMGCAGSVYTLPEDQTLGGHCVCVSGIFADEGKKLLDAFFLKRRMLSGKAGGEEAKTHE